MTFSTIITVDELNHHLHEPGWAIVDSRFTLSDPAQGKSDYLIAHIPGAVYAHLELELSGLIINGITGRHPLPSIELASEVFSNLGLDSHTQVVAYDDMGGALAASRVWWMLRWLGHEAVAVLDGGWAKWLKKGYEIKSGEERRIRGSFIPKPRNDMIVTADEVDAIRLDASFRLLDARSADRFKGENETIDPVPGHIPGAVSAPYADNLNPGGTFRSMKSLAARYKRLLGAVTTDRVVCYCGSGVTATHNILAMMVARIGEARLYAGSYSEWITDPNRPVEK